MSMSARSGRFAVKELRVNIAMDKVLEEAGMAHSVAHF